VVTQVVTPHVNEARLRQGWSPSLVTPSPRSNSSVRGRATSTTPNRFCIRVTNRVLPTDSAAEPQPKRAEFEILSTKFETNSKHEIQITKTEDREERTASHRLESLCRGVSRRKILAIVPAMRIVKRSLWMSFLPCRLFLSAFVLSGFSSARWHPAIRPSPRRRRYKSSSSFHIVRRADSLTRVRAREGLPTGTQ
jgi:hypothetical protein